MSTHLVFYSLESIFSVLKAPQHNNNENVKQLLNIYNSALEYQRKFINTSEQRSYPVIVMEGLDGSGKSTVGLRLAKQIKGNYIAALEIYVIKQKKPVVMDRYWHSSSAYALPQAIQDFPEQYTMLPAGDAFYCWPYDLMKPDIVLLLSASEDLRYKRLSKRKNLTVQEQLLNNSQKFREDILTAYKNMTNPSVELINADPEIPLILKEIDKKIKHLL